MVDVEVVRVPPGVCVVELRGEHDYANHRQLEALLIRLVKENAVVVIDVSNAAFVDSSVIGAVVRSHRAACENRTVFRLQARRNSVVWRALDVMQIERLIEFVESREEALLQPN